MNTKNAELPTTTMKGASVCYILHTSHRCGRSGVDAEANSPSTKSAREKITSKAHFRPWGIFTSAPSSSTGCPCSRTDCPVAMGPNSDWTRVRRGGETLGAPTAFSDDIG